MNKSKKEYNKLVGQCLRDARIYRGMAQKELAKELGLSPNAYNMYENGKCKCPPNVLLQVSDILDLSLDVIYKTKFKDKTTIPEVNNMIELIKGYEINRAGMKKILEYIELISSAPEYNNWSGIDYD